MIRLLRAETLGRVLRLRRTELALTLAQVSRRSGVSTQYLSEVERGLKVPLSEVIEAIACIIGTDPPGELIHRWMSLCGSSAERGMGVVVGASSGSTHLGELWAFLASIGVFMSPLWLSFRRAGRCFCLKRECAALSGQCGCLRRRAAPP